MGRQNKLECFSFKSVYGCLIEAYENTYGVAQLGDPPSQGSALIRNIKQTSPKFVKKNTLAYFATKKVL
jgi:hypothetical protein